MLNRLSLAFLITYSCSLWCAPGGKTIPLGGVATEGLSIAEKELQQQAANLAKEAAAVEGKAASSLVGGAKVVTGTLKSVVGEVNGTKTAVEATTKGAIAGKAGIVVPGVPPATKTLVSPYALGEVGLPKVPSGKIYQINKNPEKLASVLSEEELVVAEKFAAEGRDVYANPSASVKGVHGKKSADLWVEGVVSPSRTNPRGFGKVEVKTPEKLEVGKSSVSDRVVREIEDSFSREAQAPRIIINGTETVSLAEAERTLNRVVGMAKKKPVSFKSLHWVWIYGVNPDGSEFQVIHNFLTKERWIAEFVLDAEGYQSISWRILLPPG